MFSFKLSLVVVVRKQKKTTATSNKHTFRRKQQLSSSSFHLLFILKHIYERYLLMLFLYLMVLFEIAPGEVFDFIF